MGVSISADVLLPVAAGSCACRRLAAALQLVMLLPSCTQKMLVPCPFIRVCMQAQEGGRLWSTLRAKVACMQCSVFFVSAVS